MKKISILTFLALFAATLTPQGAAWAQEKDDNWGQVKTVTSEWTHITEGSTTGYELKDQYYYVSKDLTFTNTISGAGQGSGMHVQADRTVTLYIPAGVTHTVAELAKAEGVPAYVVFSNATLADMAVKRPENMDEFLEVSGVGEYKAARYGKAFLKAIREWEEKM